MHSCLHPQPLSLDLAWNFFLLAKKRWDGDHLILLSSSDTCYAPSSGKPLYRRITEPTSPHCSTPPVTLPRSRPSQTLSSTRRTASTNSSFRNGFCTQAKCVACFRRRCSRRR